jgi:pimeloyl-ACP methyl ester carboxylesterase
VLPDVQVVALERSGAFGHLEEPDRIVEEVRAFLAAAGG